MQEVRSSQVPACAMWVQNCAGKAAGCFLLGEYEEDSYTTCLGTMNKRFCDEAPVYAQPRRKPSL